MLLGIVVRKVANF